VQELETRKEPKARLKAVSALGNVGAADPTVVPALIRALKDPDRGVRAEAVLALLKIGPDAVAAVPALTEALRDADAKVRAYADNALKRIQSGRDE
jgi:HEAT repeat protein